LRFCDGAYPDVASGPDGALEDIGSLRREAEILEKRLRSVTDRIRDLESGHEKDNG